MSTIAKLNYAKHHETYYSMVDAISAAISKEFEQIDENYKDNDGELYKTYDSFIFAVSCDAVDELIDRIKAYHRSELLSAKG